MVTHPFPLSLSFSLFFVGGLGWPGKQMKNRSEKCFFVVEIEQVKRPWTWSLLTCPHSRVVWLRDVHHLRAKDLWNHCFSDIKHTLEVKKIKIWLPIAACFFILVIIVVMVIMVMNLQGLLVNVYLRLCKLQLVWNIQTKILLIYFSC